LENDAKVNHDGQPKQIASFNGHIQRRIIDDAHCPLHPVDDALSGKARRAGAADKDARIGGYRGELGRE
jgi:hypothetical protein